MSKKSIFLIAIFLVASCGFFIDRSSDYVSMEMVTELKKNDGNLIALGVLGRNLRPDTTQYFSNDPVYGRCLTQSNFVFTFFTTRKRPEDRRWESELREHFYIKKEDLVLIHQGQKLTPSKMYQGESEFNFLTSSYLAYSDYKKHSSQFVTFSLPCTKLLDPNTKLVIKRIYKDDKVIKENIEFGFIKSSDNKGHSIWLE